MDQKFLDQLPDRFMVKPGSKVSLKDDFDPALKPAGINQEMAVELLQQGVKRLAKYQEMLYAQNAWAILVILQAMDAAGKDSVIKHVMTGLNPQGCQVFSFKAPSVEELDHDYLWRCSRAVPERGRIGIFNRSYYEEVLVARVHPEVLAAQHLPEELKAKGIWKRRFEEINNFERYLTSNGIQVVKFYLNLSKEEQRRRFLARIEHPEKNWKFSASDVRERARWDDYMHAYEATFEHTSTEWAPWYVVPADHKWVTRLSVSRILHDRMKSLDLKFPQLDDAHLEELAQARVLLQQEK